MANIAIACITHPLRRHTKIVPYSAYSRTICKPQFPYIYVKTPESDLTIDSKATFDHIV